MNFVEDIDRDQAVKTVQDRGQAREGAQEKKKKFGGGKGKVSYLPGTGTESICAV